MIRQQSEQPAPQTHERGRAFGAHVDPPEELLPRGLHGRAQLHEGLRIVLDLPGAHRCLDLRHVRLEPVCQHVQEGDRFLVVEGLDPLDHLGRQGQRGRLAALPDEPPAERLWRTLRGASPQPERGTAAGRDQSDL